MTLDPRTHAVRADLADVRLAGQVFAPHYAKAMPFVVMRACSLDASREGGETLADLAPGDSFEVLELSGDLAWGVAPSYKLVGYVDREALDRSTQA